MKYLTFMILGALLGLSVAALGWSEEPEMGCTIPAVLQKESVMFDELNAVTDSTIPSIDRVVPEIFETAAFGLG